MITIQGVVHGKTIELDTEPGLASGQAVSVDIRPIAPAVDGPEAAPPCWLERFEVDPDVKPGKLVVKGTRLLADALHDSLVGGQSERDILQEHGELTPDDIAAVREYGKLPLPMRRCFGAWADEAEELNQYLDWTRQHRSLGRRRLDD